jgi:hypothetical protein
MVAGQRFTVGCLQEARESALRHLDTGCGAIEDVEDYIEGVFLNPMMVVHA